MKNDVRLTGPKKATGSAGVCPMKSTDRPVMIWSIEPQRGGSYPSNIYRDIA